MKIRNTFILSLLLLALASVLGACGESSTTTATPQEVRIVMGEMYVKSPITTFKVGQPYKFVLVNEGKIPHEFTIAPTRKGGETEGDLDKKSLLDADQLQAGQTTIKEFTFKDPAPSGKLEFECSYPGHYDGGMHVPIVVE